MKHPRHFRVTAVLLLLFISLPALAIERMRLSSGEELKVIPNQVLVKYKAGKESQGRARVFSALGATKKMSLEEINVDLVRIPPGETIQSFIEKLKSDPNVEYAEPNGVIKAFVAPNDTNYGTQYALGVNFINVEQAWDITQGAASVVIAGIDTGVDLTHDDMINQLWTNPNPLGTSGLHGSQMEIDWNGDGDCGDTDPDTGPEQCADGTPQDDNNPTYHGTRTAGIMVAEANNGATGGGMAGICRNCKVMVVKVLNADGFGSFGAIAQGITYAAANGASVINLSLGAPAQFANQAVRDAVKFALERNVVVVAAAGNDGNDQAVSFPANISNVVAVGATQTDGTSIAAFSCTGSAMDISAPGVDVLATIPVDTTEGTVDGTSFSSPMVAATAGLIRSVNPTLSVNEVVKYLDYTATDLGTAGFDATFGFGRLNAGAAVRAAYNHTIFASSSTTTENKTFPYPNPFRPGTDRTLTIRIPPNLGSQNIEITVMNSAGETVKTLNNTNVWDGRNDEGNLIASGLYFYFVKTSAGDSKGKLTVIK